MAIWLWLCGAFVAYVALRFAAFKTYTPRLKAYWRRSPSRGNFNLIALGDSTMQGIGATSPARTAVGRIAAYIAAKYGHQVRIINLSRAGVGIDDVLTRQLTRASLDQADLIIISVGANDMRQGMSYKEFTTKYQHLLRRMPKDRVIVADVPNIANRHNKQLSGRVWNPQLKTFFANQGVAHALVFERIWPHRFDPRLYGADLFHPSNFGYKLSAEAFEPSVDAILERLNNKAK